MLRRVTYPHGTEQAYRGSKSHNDAHSLTQSVCGELATFRGTRHSKVKDPDASWPSWRLQSSPWQSPFQTKPEVFTLSHGFRNYVNESHEKLLDVEMDQKPISTFYILSTCSASPRSPALLRTVMCTRSPSITLRQEVLINCYRDRSSLYKVPKLTPNQFPLYPEKGLSQPP